MLSASTKSRHQCLDPRALRGVPAYLYILKNSGLKEGMLHIGLSRRGGWAKALELNRDKNNSIPGNFECVFELRSQDSGSAFESVLEILKHARHGRSSQDYFEIDELSAQHIIERCVEEADKGFQRQFQQGLAFREYQEERNRAWTSDAEQQQQPVEVIREGIFKKALAWLS